MIRRKPFQAQPLPNVLASTTAAFTIAQRDKLALLGNHADYGTAAQGTKADTAVQPAALNDYRPLALMDMASNLPPIGEYTMTTASGAGGSTTGTLAGAANRCELFPWVPQRTITIDMAAINCTAAVASATGKIVVYASDPATGLPGALLIETGTLDYSTTGVKTVALAYTFQRGVQYWLGHRHSSTATISTWAPGAVPDISGGSPVTARRKTVRRTMTFANPATTPWVWASGEITAVDPPAIWLRRA